MALLSHGRRQPLKTVHVLQFPHLKFQSHINTTRWQKFSDQGPTRHQIQRHTLNNDIRWDMSVFSDHILCISKYGDGGEQGACVSVTSDVFYSYLIRRAHIFVDLNFFVASSDMPFFTFCRDEMGIWRIHYFFLHGWQICIFSQLSLAKSNNLTLW
jgi:hypothetical protein